MQNSNGVEILITTSYIPDEDVTIVWQHINIPSCDFQQIAIVGWYCGEPDDNLTEINSHNATVATLI